MIDSTQKPHVLLDYIIKKGWAKDDKAIAKLLNTSPPVISRVRNNKINPNARLILSVYDHTNLTIEEIRALIKGKKPQGKN
jgi:transcriptional regulator with XRE-family HTH domain